MSRIFDVLSVVSFSMVFSIISTMTITFGLNIADHFSAWELYLISDNVSMVVGCIACIYLLIKVRIASNNHPRRCDPSYDAKLFFLWIFGVSGTLQYFLYFLVDIECLFFHGGVNTLFIDPLFMRFLTMMYLVLQVVTIIKRNGGGIHATRRIRFFTNLVILIDLIFLIRGTVQDMNQLYSKSKFIHHFNVTNSSQFQRSQRCFWESRVQKVQAAVTHYTMPLEFEFYVLAVVLLFQSRNRTIRNGCYDINMTIGELVKAIKSRKKLVGVSIYGALFLVVGVSLRLTMLISEGSSSTVGIAKIILQLLISINNCVTLCFVSGTLRIWMSGRHSVLMIKDMFFSEFIIRIAMMAIAAYYSYIIAFPEKDDHFPFNCLTSLLSLITLFYQTVFVLCDVPCFEDRRSTQTASVFLCMCFVFLTMDNFYHWTIHIFFDLRVKSDWIIQIEINNWQYYVRRILDPISLYYRFHVSMEFYSQLKKVHWLTSLYHVNFDSD